MNKLLNIFNRNKQPTNSHSLPTTRNSPPATHDSTLIELRDVHKAYQTPAGDFLAAGFLSSDSFSSSFFSSFFSGR